MDAQVIALILLSAVTLIVVWINAAALRSFARQIEGQREDVHAIHTAQRDLEHRLHRLAAAIDQSREQLHRALELASAVHLLLYARLRDPLKLISEEDAGKIHTYLIELKAIAVVNGDTEFIDLVGRLRVAVESCSIRPVGKRPPGPRSTCPKRRAASSARSTICWPPPHAINRGARTQEGGIRNRATHAAKSNPRCRYRDR